MSHTALDIRSACGWGDPTHMRRSIPPELMMPKVEEAMRTGEPDPLIGTDTRAEQAVLHDTIDLESLLAIERRTVER